MNNNEQSNNIDKSISMADGCITIQHPDHNIKFSIIGDKVLMNKDGKEDQKRNQGLSETSRDKKEDKRSAISNQKQIDN